MGTGSTADRGTQLQVERRLIFSALDCRLASEALRRHVGSAPASRRPVDIRSCPPRALYPAAGRASAQGKQRNVVLREPDVNADEGEAFGAGLGDQHAVEGGYVRAPCPLPVGAVTEVLCLLEPAP
jgi:hypothetical protein